MKTVEITIGGRTTIIDDPEKIPITIDYALEEEADFQRKKGSQAVDIRLPAALLNQQQANTFHNPSVEDLTADETFRNPEKAVIKSGGHELLVGKALLKNASHTDRPEQYIYNFYGDNVDWMIDLKETTLFDCLQHLNFTFTKEKIIESWGFDGTNEALPFVFAPVRYRESFADGNMIPTYMKPALSKYWILYWGFKLAGYRINSQFFDTPYFRRQVMPWTWGSFLLANSTRLDNLNFLAKSTVGAYMWDSYNGFWDLNVSNDSTDGAYDNNDVYSYEMGEKAMKWTYLSAFNYGNVDVRFRGNITLDGSVSGNSRVEVKVYWYKNGVQQGDADVLIDRKAPAIGRRDIFEIMDFYRTVNVNPGDVVKMKVHLYVFQSGLGNASITGNMNEFTIAYIRIPLGGQINFENYTSLKKYKFLDFFRGIIDEFNLSLKTNTTTKEVLIEPTHPYKLPGESIQRPGFFLNDHLDWSGKLDLSKVSELQLFDDYEREVIFKYKEDNQDGIQKIIRDRYTTEPAGSKYVLPARFKAGKKEHENRFFSSAMHYEVLEWKSITGTAPQMIIMVPENISNTSNVESESTFAPKSVFYKGTVGGLGWIFDGEELNSFPMMFSVNYMPGGQNDPVLSYSDERIGNDTAGYQLSQGLMKKFFWQRLAIIRHGAWHNTWIRLTNSDAASPWHREYKTYLGHRWELIQITGFDPFSGESTRCTLRKWVPVGQKDEDNSFPSQSSVLDGTVNSEFDTRYATLKCLTSDIPK